MARTSRIPRTLHDLLQAMDHQQFLLRQNLHDLRNDLAHLKPLSSGLRTLICESSRTEGLLWRLVEQLGVSDVIELIAAESIQRDAPLLRGMTMAQIPLHRQREAPPGLPDANPVSLRYVIKNCEAVYVAQFADRKFTHEGLISTVANQLGGAHESEGLDYSLVNLQKLLRWHRW